MSRLPCCLSMGPLKRDFLDIYLTRFLESVISKMQNLWGSSFFGNFQNFIEISGMNKKNQKIFFVFEIISSDLVSLNCLYSEQDTCHRQPMRQQAVPRFCMSIRGTLYKSNAFTLINKSQRAALIQISTASWPVYHVACRSVLWSGSFQIFI